MTRAKVAKTFQILKSFMDLEWFILLVDIFFLPILRVLRLISSLFMHGKLKLHKRKDYQNIRAVTEKTCLNIIPEVILCDIAA